MITKEKKLIALPIALVLALSGCFGGSSSDDDEEIVEPTDPVIVAPDPAPELSLVVSGNVVDSDSINVVFPVTLAFREDGQPSESIATIDGEPVSEMTSEDGSFSFTLREDATPEQVRVLVHAEGYFEKRFDVNLVTDEEDDIEVEFAIVARESDDSASAEVEEGVADATTSVAVTATAESENAGGEATVPQGTQLLTASGDPVTGSSVSLRVGAVNPKSERFGAAIPAGLNTGAQSDIGIPTGVVDVTMGDNLGNNVKSFSNPINVSMRLPVDTEAPSGDRTIETGDEFDLFSYDEETGEWSAEDVKGVVGQLNQAGTAYRVSFETDHLTWFVTSRSEPVCTSDVAVTFSGDEVPTSGLRLSISSATIGASASFNVPASASAYTVFTAEQVAPSNISADATLRIRVRDGSNNVWYDSVEEIPVCATVPDLALENPTPNVVDETITLTAVCSNDTSVTTDVSGAIVRFRETGSGTPFQSARGNGDGTYSLRNLNGDAESYTLSINPRIAAAFTDTITPDGDDETIEFSIECEEVTGS